MRIHLVIVVNHEGVTWCYVHREHRLLDTRHGDAQLHAVAIHEVVGWNVEIVGGLVVFGTCEEVVAVLVYLVSLLIGVFRCRGFKQPTASFFKLDVALVILHEFSLFILQQLAYVPEVAIRCECLVSGNFHLVLLQANHFARQGTVVDGDATREVRSLHILDGKVDGVGVVHGFAILVCLLAAILV